jgi:transposase-like protein
MSDSVNLVSLIQQFGNDDKCREYLEALRWNEGIQCPRCDHDKATKIANREQYYCLSCHYNFSVTAGTIFNDSHLPLMKWFLATYLLCESRKGMSANQIKRTLGISYKTAWYLCHRIRAAMKDAEIKPKLDGVVEMDETYVGGHHTGHGRGEAAQENKQVVIGIKQRNGKLRFFHAADASSGTLAQYVRENISEDVEVLITDSFPGYNKNVIDGRDHEIVNHRRKEYARYENGFCITTNGIESAFSLLKRGIIGSWHKVSAKHLQAYLDEMTWRFDNRNNPYLFRDTMMKLIEAPVLEYKKLTQAA